jgi:hypothetical protein
LIREILTMIRSRKISMYYENSVKYISVVIWLYYIIEYNVWLKINILDPCIHQIGRLCKYSKITVLTYKYLYYEYD